MTVGQSMATFLVLAAATATTWAVEEGQLRLVIGTRVTTHEGRGNVEIYHANRWGAICDDEWDSREADVVCSMMGYANASRVTTNGHFGKALRPFLMDNLYCNGHEVHIEECQFDGWGVHDCGREEAAGVICDKDPEATATPVTTPAAPVPKWHVGAFEGKQTHEVRKKQTNLHVVLRYVCRTITNLRNALILEELTLWITGVALNILLALHFKNHENVILVWEFIDLGDKRVSLLCLRTELADLVIDEQEVERSAYLEDRQLLYLQCAMEENCLSTSAYALKSDPGWLYESRRLLRFTARVANVGSTTFKPFLPKHAWLWHSCHMHYHSMEVFAHFDVLDLEGRKVAEGHKASFCLEDNVCQPGIEKTYSCANYGDQGISIGCTDTYAHNIDCQWVDMSDVAHGQYIFKVSINPEYKMAEISYDNNAALCDLTYTQTFAAVTNCTLVRP
ncbi:unnamed protein product [Ixodes pacificus]